MTKMSPVVLPSLHKRTSVKSGVNDLLVAASDAVTSRKSLNSAASDETFRENDRLLSELTLEIPPSTINGFGSLVNFAPSSTKPVHRWFWYREGYSQELVDGFVRDLPRGSLVLDPFCGAGTSLIAAQRMGLPSVGFDVNPISILVSRVKLTSLSRALVKQLNESIASLKLLDAAAPSDEKPALKIIGKVFDSAVLHALLVFRRAIKEERRNEVREFLFVAWLSILEGVSNVYKEGNGVKYKNRKRTDSGYIHIDLKTWEDASFPEDRFAFVRDRLVSKIEDMVADLKHIPADAPVSALYEVSAETASDYLEPNSVSLAIFSPPYCNCFNYFKMYKIELWMGEFVSSYEQMRELNRRGLRSHVETVLKRPGDKSEVVSEEFARLLDGVPLWDGRIPNAVRGYFMDMRDVMVGLHSVLKPSGKSVIVVGNSSYGGVVIPTDAILAKIAIAIGFKVQKLAVARSLTTSSQQRQHLLGRDEYLRESILVLEKVDKRLVDKPLDTVDEIPLQDSDREGRVFLIRNNGLTAGTHKFHRYPGKFIPHVPRWALGRYASSSTVVLDPFCGSGTTLVEAGLRGISSYGIDVDPIARLVSKVKTTPISSDELVALVVGVKQKLGRKRVASFRPRIATLGHWFTDAAIHDLGCIRDVIETYRHVSHSYDFLLICFAAIIRRASNADNQTQKTYVSHTKLKEPEDATILFLKTLDDYAARIIDLPSRTSSTIINASALQFSSKWAQEGLPQADLIITSPPYLNSVDYVYNQMAEYFWIGDLFGLETQTLQNGHKRSYVGTSQVSREQYRTQPHMGISGVDEVVHRIARKSEKNGFIVGKYFQDMRQHLSEAFKVMASRGTYVMVVGDSSVSGEPVSVSELIADVAQLEGFALVSRFGYEIRNRHMRFPRMGRGGILRYDWVLVLERVA